MEKKIYYVTDWQYKPGYYRFEKHRFPQAYLELVPWYLVNYADVPQEIKGKDNIIIVNTPVHNELSKMKLIDSLMDDNDVFIVQEGTVWCWMYDWAAPEQELYMKLLSKSCGYLCSNIYDQKMMSLYVDNTVLVPPCTNVTAEEPRSFVGDYAFIVNPAKGYQRGMMSHKLAYDSIPDTLKVYSMQFDRSPHIGRMISLPDSYTLPGFELLPRMGYEDFMKVVYSSRFGIDIHRDFSAGQTAVDFGSVGVPLVGNIQLDSQRIIFPETSFEWDDYDSIKKCIRQLSVDEDFCKEVGEKALANTKKYYNSTKIVEDFILEFNKTLTK